MALGNYGIDVDWDGAGTYGGSANVSARVLSAAWSAGRDYASQLIGKSVPGQLTVYLNNESKDYSPFNTSSPLTGSLLPGRLVRVRMWRGTAAAVIMWTGYLQSLVPEPSVKGLSVARLDAIGPLGHYGQKNVNLGHQVNITTGSLFTTLLQSVTTLPSGWTDVIDTGQTTITRSWYGQTPLAEALQDVEDTEAGFMVETPSGYIAFEDRHHRSGSAHQVSQATFSDAGTGLTYSDISEDDSIQSVFNRLQTDVQLYGTGTLGTLWTLPIAGTSYPQLNRTGEVLTIWAEYPTPDAPSDDIAVDSWTTPTSGVDYFANSQANGSGLDRSSNVVMTVSKFGNRIKMDVSNNNPTADIWLTSLNVRGVPVQKLDPITVGVQDDVSGTLYGTRDYPNPAKLVPTLGEADNWAKYHLNIFKIPQPVLAVTIDANRDDAHLEQAQLRTISERITIVGTGNAGLGIKEDFFIEAIRHSVEGNRRHRVTWLCSQAERFSDVWVVGFSKVGTNTRVAY